MAVIIRKGKRFQLIADPRIPGDIEFCEQMKVRKTQCDCCKESFFQIIPKNNSFKRSLAICPKC